MGRRSRKKALDAGHASAVSEAWLPARTGLLILGAVSLTLGAWTTIQALKVSGLVESVLWGVGFAASIWVVFGVVFFVNKKLRGR